MNNSAISRTIFSSPNDLFFSITNTFFPHLDNSLAMDRPMTPAPIIEQLQNQLFNCLFIY